jgi:putative transposase
MSIASGVALRPTLAVRDASVPSAMSTRRRNIRATAATHSYLSGAARCHPMRAERAWRLWRLAGLTVPRKRPRRRMSVHRPQPATAARHVWAYGCVFDACAGGLQLKCLCGDR